MYLTSARVAHHANNFAAGGAAHDRIVHQNHALAFQLVAHGIELQLYAEVANGLRRFDKRSPYIMIADKRLPERYVRFRRKADGSGHARIGNGHHDIGGHRGFTRQQSPQILARLSHR